MRYIQYPYPYYPYHPYRHPYEWTHCPVMPSTTTAPDMQEKQQVVPTGWVCPKCGVVNAPFVAECRCSSALAEKG
ncbi:MAG: hypothetical protein BWY68_00301 [bacterium ADurb.Bin400]|nr:MAG: hypothetical protein BWY68_00301 [bacterium ADurb.Bin400]